MYIKTLKLIIVLAISSIPSAYAQRQTYFGAGLTMGTATNVNNQNIFSLSGDFIDAGSYNVTFRQEINDLLSISTGIYAGTYYPGFSFEGFSFGGGMITHNIPLEVNLDIEAIHKKLDLFVLFGNQFCLESSSTLGGISRQKINGFILEDTENYIKDQQLIGGINCFITYHTGFGARWRLWRELHFETTIGFSSSIKPLLKYDIFITNPIGETKTFSFNEPIDFWFMSFRFTYSIQDLMMGIRKLSEAITEV